MLVDPHRVTACVLTLMNLTAKQLAAVALFGEGLLSGDDVDEQDRLWTEAERDLPPPIWFTLLFAVQTELLPLPGTAEWRAFLADGFTSAFASAHA